MNITKNTATYLGPKINKLANQTKNAVIEHYPNMVDGIEDTTTKHIWPNIEPKIVKPSGNFIKNTAIKVKNISV